MEEVAEQVEQHVLTALKELGDTPLEVFENLLALKCYGEVSNSESCPVWHVLDRMALDKFIAERIPDFEYVDFQVDSGGICLEYGYESGPQYGETVIISPPEAVKEFIIGFDSGIFPQLAAE